MLVLAAAIVLAAIIHSVSKSRYHVKPRLAFAQAAVVGKTEDSETVQLTTTLFEDETVEEWDEKMDKLYDLREKRLKHQNERMIEIQAEAKRVWEEEKLKRESGESPPMKLSTK